jgi:DNA-binding NarL/FixJ family response regulator
MEAVKLAIIDDHEVVINGLKAMLSNNDDLKIVFTTTQADVLLSFLKNYGADVILMDIQMPEISGIDLCKMVLKQYPDIKVIAFSSFDDTHYIRQVLRNGRPATF